MTQHHRLTEFAYRNQERLAILCGDNPRPSPLYVAMAMREAQEAVNEIERNEKQDEQPSSQPN